jgi:flagellin
MERLATGKANANAGDRSSYVAMADTFRLDFVGTKAGIKGASVAMGYLETGMRVLDSASGLLSRLQELAVLGANDTNTDADHEAINLEAEAIADEFNRLMTTASYKGKKAFVDVASSQYVSMGGRDQEMTFGIGTIDYSSLYSDARKIAGGPNDGKLFNLSTLPSDAVAAKKYGTAEKTGITGATGLEAGKTYIVTTAGADDNTANGGDAEAIAIQAAATRADGTTAIAQGDGTIVDGYDIKTTSAVANVGDNVLKQMSTSNLFIQGAEYEVVTAGASFGDTTTNFSDAAALLAATSITGASISVGDRFTVNSGTDITAAQFAALNALTDGATFRRIGATDEMTSKIEDIQALINTARVQAGSQYAAMESAVNYTTDLTAQYELGYNTVNDVNFSMETAHLAKNQILQQAATAMLAQANSGQQGLLQLIS